MALFAKKTSKETEPKDAKQLAVVREVSTNPRDFSRIIKRPRVTEKASMKAESNVYTFEVDLAANKSTVAAAVKEMFNVTPLKIAIVTIPKKNVFVRGKSGVSGGGKKAYVYLKKGETIEFV